MAAMVVGAAPQQKMAVLRHFLCVLEPKHVACGRKRISQNRSARANGEEQLFTAMPPRARPGPSAAFPFLGGSRMQQTPVLLDGYINLIDASRERGMPSLRTLQRMALEGKLPTARIGRNHYMSIERFREILRDGTTE
jgi:hypothetical protein